MHLPRDGVERQYAHRLTQRRGGEGKASDLVQGYAPAAHLLVFVVRIRRSKLDDLVNALRRGHGHYLAAARRPRPLRRSKARNFPSAGAAGDSRASLSTSALNSS
jgi:hypothetical protein